MSLRTLVVSAALLLPSAALATPAANGKYFNTDALNGKYFNGKYFNGQALEAVATTSAWKDGFGLGSTAVHGSGLAGWVYDWSDGAAATWQWRTGEWFVGTNLIARYVNRVDGATETVNLHIDAITPAEKGSDVLLHLVSVQTYVEVYDQLQNVSYEPVAYPLCGYDGASRPIPAIVLRGEWSEAEGVSWGGDQISDDPYQVTFACVTGALGKCAADCTTPGACEAQAVPVALGYRRWAAPRWWAVEDADGSIAYHWRDYAMEHQACTRMIRADYCGNGVSMTADGTQIDVYDRMHDNWWDEATSVPPAWFFDATWNEDGAVMISCGRASGDAVICSGTPTVAGPLAAFDLDNISDPTTVHPLQCLHGDGLADPAVRLGNLRQALPGE